MTSAIDIQETYRATTHSGVAPRVFALLTPGFLYWWRRG